MFIDDSTVVYTEMCTQFRSYSIFQHGYVFEPVENRSDDFLRSKNGEHNRFITVRKRFTHMSESSRIHRQRPRSSLGVATWFGTALEWRKTRVGHTHTGRSRYYDDRTTSSNRTIRPDSRLLIVKNIFVILRLFELQRSLFRLFRICWRNVKTNILTISNWDGTFERRNRRANKPRRLARRKGNSPNSDNDIEGLKELLKRAPPTRRLADFIFYHSSAYNNRLRGFPTFLP